MPKMLIEIDTDTQVVVPRVTSVSSEMKAKFIGEFSWSESLEDYDNAIIEYIVPWWVCKEIFHRMAQHWISAATQPTPIPTAWQPIETAPKGYPVLLSDGRGVHVGFWDVDRWVTGITLDTEDGGARSMIWVRINAVCWMEIPQIKDEFLRQIPPAPGGEQ